MRKCTSRGAGFAHHLHDLHARRAAHDRIVDQHDALARDDRAIGVVLEANAEFADRLGRLDEGASDVVIADDAELEGNAAGLGVAERRRHAGVGHRHDDVGARRGLARELARPSPCARRRPIVRARSSRAGRNRCIRRCTAACVAAGTASGSATPSASMTTTSPFSMSRTNLAPMMSSAQVSEHRIGQPLSSPSTSGRMPSGSRAPISFLLVSATSA